MGNPINLFEWQGGIALCPEDNVASRKGRNNYVGYFLSMILKFSLSKADTTSTLAHLGIIIRPQAF